MHCFCYSFSGAVKSRGNTDKSVVSSSRQPPTSKGRPGKIASSQKTKPTDTGHLSGSKRNAKPTVEVRKTNGRSSPDSEKRNAPGTSKSNVR